MQLAASSPILADGTSRLIDLVHTLEWDNCPSDARHAARRHLLDTIGVMIAGAPAEVTVQAEGVLAALRSPGLIPVPGRARRADLLDAAFLGGTAGHGVELDDGYRQGAVHPGVCVVPAAIYAAFANHSNGSSLLEAVLIGYEAMIGVAVSCHPELRTRGFHPTSVVGVFGAAAAAARLYGLDSDATSRALGIAASSGAGLFAFIGGGSDIKRLHAGHAAREGLQSVLLAKAGISGPSSIIEARDGFAQAFAYGRSQAPRIAKFPPDAPFAITDCYIKPHACCRHLQPALEALLMILDEHGIGEADIHDIRVETYRIASEHGETGWSEFASAQLSFPYIMAIGARYRAIRPEHFAEELLNDPGIAALCARVHVSSTPELDELYPTQRPARVTVVTDKGTFTRERFEALGSRDMPIDDKQLGEKFITLVGPVLGQDVAVALLDQLWRIEEMGDVSPLIEGLALASSGAR